MLDIKEIQEKLDDFDTQLTENERLKANLEGKKETIIEKLKEEFDVTEKDDIKKLIEKNEKELEEMGVEIQEKVDKLEEDYDWED